MDIDPNIVIDRLGGTTAVARLCDVKPSSVHGWRTHGIPKARLQYLSLAHPEAFTPAPHPRAGGSVNPADVVKASRACTKADHCVRLIVDASAAEAAIARLRVLAEESPEIAKLLIDGVLDSNDLVRIDSSGSAASGADEYRVSLQPTQRFLDFLTASAAGDRQ